MNKIFWKFLTITRRLTSYALLAILIIAFHDPYQWPNVLHTLPDIQFGQLLAGFFSFGSLKVVLYLTLLILITLLVGRFFCALLCPLGAFMDLVNLVRRTIKPGQSHFKPNGNWRYFLPSLVLVLFWLGITLPFSLLEPYSILTSKSHFYQGPNLIFWLVFIGAIFKGRGFCNSFCPTGLVQRLISRTSLFRIQISKNCVNCGACLKKCPASCINTSEKKVDHDRCLLCLECLSVCPKKALTYAPVALKLKKQIVNRRIFLKKGTAIVVALGAFLTPEELRSKMIKVPQPSPVLPPGALALAHLNSHCSHCHTCIRICPNKALVPGSLKDGSPFVVDKPVLDAYKGFCQYDCTLCTNICPTGALVNLDVETKHSTRLALVHLNRLNCVVVKNNTSCGACAELCPTGAVSMENGPSGREEPTLNEKYCIGCGACHKACPVRPATAIWIEGIPYQQTATLPEKIIHEDISFTNDFPF
jgi:ferredoxin